MPTPRPWLPVGSLSPGPMRFVRESEQPGIFVSTCPYLHIVSQGTSIREAVESLDDAIAMYLAYCAPKHLSKRGIARGSC